MTKDYFKEMMAELSFYTVDGLAIGLVGCWPCSVQWDKEGFTLRVAASESLATARKALREAALPHTRWYTQKDGEAPKGAAVLVGLLAPPSDFYAKSCLRGALALVPKTLDEVGLVPPSRCPLCGAEGCDSWAFLDDALRVVHKNCLCTKLDLPEKDSRAPRVVRGNYALGVLGALLGGTIAALPNWAQALSKGEIHPVLYVFVPVLAALVYRLFRGKARLGAGGGIVLGASLAVSFALELIWFWLVATTAAGGNLPIAQTTAQYFSTHSLGLTIQEMGISLLFLLLGFFVSAVLLRRYVAAGNTPGRLVRGKEFVCKTGVFLGEDKTMWPLFPPETVLQNEAPGDA